MMPRLQYLHRIAAAYLLPGQSQLTFWHGAPLAESRAPCGQLGDYYMDFSQKADYSGPHDAEGVPMLDYRGRIGKQYNPIAIAQWGLGNCNLLRATGSADRKRKLVIAADWLWQHLEKNSHGVWVWNHHFDWEYRTPLKAPWYSALAQGQGISLLVRAHKQTSNPAYLEGARRAFGSLLCSTDEGGVTYTDQRGDLWLEEYVVSPPTHILNGFIWAAWGVWDFFLAAGDSAARDLFERSVATLRANLSCYDIGFWSLYEQSGTRMPMVASPFYHQLHIVQLRIMYRLTGHEIFAQYADRWEKYAHSRSKRTRAVCYKSAFKLCYY